MGMKVMMLVESLTLGGLPNHVLTVSRALQDAGDDMVLVHATPVVPDHLETHGLTLVDLSGPLASGHADVLVDAMQALQPDVLHVHLCSHPAWLEAIARMPQPKVRSFHDYTSMCLRMGRRRYPGDRCHRPLGASCLMFGCWLGAPEPGELLPRLIPVRQKLAEARQYRDFDAAVVGSQHMLRMLKVNGYQDTQCHLIPYFNRFDATARVDDAALPHRPGRPGSDRPVEMLFTGQAIAGKGLLVLLDALRDLPGTWRFTAVTAGPQLNLARDKAAQLTMTDRVRFLDWLPQSQLAELYSQSDLLVVPSVWDDPGPLVGLEAMSHGTPVVAFPVGGLTDYVRNGQTGWLAEQVSVTALQGALMRAMADLTEPERWRHRARQHVAKHHSKHVHIDSLRRLHQQLLEVTP
jgi:glycosyltransferase involved in cell wall biosynthesis